LDKEIDGVPVNQLIEKWRPYYADSNEAAMLRDMARSMTRGACGPAAVLVQRGWVQRNFLDREKLPPIETPPGVVEVSGRLAPPPVKLYEFADAQGGTIRQNLDLAQFRAETGLALLDVAVQQTGPPSEGLLRDWPEAASGVQMHYGYAFQWWALSGLIAILYAWFQFIVPRRKSSHD